MLTLELTSPLIQELGVKNTKPMDNGNLVPIELLLVKHENNLQFMLMPAGGP